MASEKWALRHRLVFECIWIFWVSIASLWSSIGVAYRGYMSRLTDSEEPQAEEHDPNYTEELGDDLLGATSHPTS